MRGKNKDGTFQSPFNPYKWGDAFTEGNSWHYTWSVFHDIQGLIDLMGGNQLFANKLDSVFLLPPIFDDSYYGGVIHEIREMQIANMGQYAHGNQPIQHMIYLYNYAGAPWKTQYWARKPWIECTSLHQMDIAETKIMARRLPGIFFQQWVFTLFVQQLTNMC
jgi:putative alpha-1,2-mannosidase